MTGSQVKVTASTATPATIRIVGDNNQLISDVLTNTTLWLDGNTLFGFSRFILDQDLANHGTIRLDNSSNDGNNEDSYLTVRTGTLTNAADGRIEAIAGQGDGRYLTGNLTNQGTIFVETGIALNVHASAFLQQGGTVDAQGKLVHSGGAFAFHRRRTHQAYPHRRRQH